MEKDYTPKDGDYCRLIQFIIRIDDDGKNQLCDECIYRCKHSGNKMEQDYLLKSKINEKSS